MPHHRHPVGSASASQNQLTPCLVRRWTQEKPFRVFRFAHFIFAHLQSGWLSQLREHCKALAQACISAIIAGLGKLVPIRDAVPNHGVKEELDSRFRGPLFSYFLRRTKNASEAEDLTQETFARLVGSRTFEHADEAPAFVFRVASNLLRDRARFARRSGNSPVSGGGSSEEEAAPKLIEVLDPERVLLARERLNEVMACLDELGERTRNMFILFRLEGMRQKDIAACYGVSLSTVEKNVTTAIIRLAKRFGRP